MRVQVAGIELEYELLEPSSAAEATVLLIMGLGQQLIAWPDDFCERMVEAGLRVLRYDHRDSGFSTKIEGVEHIGLTEAFLRLQTGALVTAPYDLGTLAGDAFGLLDALGIQEAHVVGASMGGMIAQIMAAERPERVRSLTSIMSTSGERGLPPGRPEALALLANRPSGARDELIEFGVRAKAVLAGPGYPTSEAERRAVTARAVDRMWYPPGYVRQTLAVLASPDRRALLEGLRVPTLVIHGQDDPLVPVEHGMRTAELVPGSRLEIIDGMGHDFAPGARDLMARIIADFVREQESRGSSEAAEPPSAGQG